MTCRLLLADDHALIRVGVKAMVHELEGYEVVGEAEDGEEAIKKAIELQPDIILLDVSMNRVGGLEALGTINREVPEARVLMLSMHAEAKVVLDSLELGASGYLLKDAAMSEMHLALRAVGRGDRYLSSAVASYVIDQALSHVKKAPVESELTPRQVEMLRLITRGASTRDIAEGLGLSVKTVEAHRAQIMRRLQIHDVPGLVLYAIREGVIGADD